MSELQANIDEVDVLCPWVFGDGETDISLYNFGDEDDDEHDIPVW